MKKSIVTSAILAALLFSCSEKDEPSASLAPEGAIIAKIGEEDWKSTLAVASVANNRLSIIGTSANGSQVVLSLSSFEVNNHNISGIINSNYPENVVAFTPENATTNNPTYSSTNLFEQTSIGMVTVTAIDKDNKTVSGTFFTKVKRSVPEDEILEVQTGSFSKIPYTEGTGITGNTASAKVNGVAFVPAQVGGTVAFGNIVINIIDSSNKIISITTPSSVAAGTFTFEPMGADYNANYSSGSLVFDSTGGKLIITKHDKTAKRIEGTFTFTGQVFMTTNTASITEGKFALTYF